MDKLPILGKEIIMYNLFCRDVEFHGLRKLSCSKCGKYVTTFDKSIHNANTIICNQCGHIIKSHIPSVKLQKSILNNTSNYYKRKNQSDNKINFK